MKKRSDHEIFSTKIFIHVIVSNFTKILNHENLELYCIQFPSWAIFKHKIICMSALAKRNFITLEFETMHALFKYLII